MYSLHYILQEAFVDKDIFFLSPLVNNWVKRAIYQNKEAYGEN